MGAKMTGGGGRRRKSRGRRHMAEINVTPFVDVMLVLLIIFMVAAPLMSVGVQVDLPQTAARPLPTEPREVVRVQISRDGEIRLEDAVVSLDNMPSRLAALYGDEGGDRAVYILGDLAAQHGVVMRVMATLQQAGYEKFTFPTEFAGPGVGAGQE